MNTIKDNLFNAAAITITMADISFYLTVLVGLTALFTNITKIIDWYNKKEEEK